MGRLLTPPPYYGTFHNLCVYHMRGEDFVRTRSSLTGERVKTAPEFIPTMAWAALLKQASRLGAAVYSMLAPYRKKHKLYKKLTGQAMRLLKEGKTEGETVVELMLFIQFKKKKRAARPKAQQAIAPVATRRRPVRSGNKYQKAMQRIGRTRQHTRFYTFLHSRILTGGVPEVISHAPG